MTCTNKQQETAECEKRGCSGCFYNQEVDDLITVYMSGFYDGEKKWKDKIKAKKELLLKSNELMTEEQRQTDTQFQQGKLIAYEELLGNNKQDKE